MAKKIVLESSIVNDNYTNFVYDTFDIQDRSKSTVEIPMIDMNELLSFSWNIGVILGNSGSGKSTILKSIGDVKTPIYNNDKAIVSQFSNMSEKEVCDILSSVGLSSIPTYLRKPNQLSNGEKARLDLAWLIANANDDELILIDEFTSVVNRSCAKSLSFALQRYIRSSNKKIILVSCHFDIIEWLQPDWVYNLNKQIDDSIEIERFIYEDDAEYKTYNKVNEKDVLSDEKYIN